MELVRGALPVTVMPSLCRFSMRRPPCETEQSRALDWIAAAHVASEAARGVCSAIELRSFEERMRRVVRHCACKPAAIATRGHVTPDVGNTAWDEMLVYDFSEHPEGRGSEFRTRVYRDFVEKYFVQEFARDETAPSDLIHVTCTGYVSPSGAQRLVERRGWGERTRVTHAYHMGCYASLPAVRLAMGALRAPSSADGDARVDVVHTELCSLHLNPADHSPEQVIIQSLFADGLIRYSVVPSAPEPSLRILATRETIVPDSSDAMRWAVGDSGMTMTLSQHVPHYIALALRDFVGALYRDAGLDAGHDIGATVFAVHPGGPRILDEVRDRLELREEQVRVSRDVFLSYGNMSSATLPHIWMRILQDASITAGTHVASLAFGPGLTMCGALFRKE